MILLGFSWVHNLFLSNFLSGSDGRYVVDLLVQGSQHLSLEPLHHSVHEGLVVHIQLLACDGNNLLHVFAVLAHSAVNSVHVLSHPALTEVSGHVEAFLLCLDLVLDLLWVNAVRCRMDDVGEGLVLTLSSSQLGPDSGFEGIVFVSILGNSCLDLVLLLDPDSDLVLHCFHLTSLVFDMLLQTGDAAMRLTTFGVKTTFGTTHYLVLASLDVVFHQVVRYS